MGFEPQIRDLLGDMPEKTARQTIFFTATWPKEVQNLANEFLSDPVQVNIGDGDSLNANKAITQKIILCQQKDKQRELFKILKNVNTESNTIPSLIPKTIIFVARRADCDNLADQLRFFSSF
jgi:ATP-dependent RNA helicase DDX5/DBP2